MYLLLNNIKNGSIAQGELWLKSNIIKMYRSGWFKLLEKFERAISGKVLS
jgi:hypothetical protein